MIDALVRAAGFDPATVQRLAPGERRLFVVVGVLVVVAGLLAATSAGYGGWLAFADTRGGVVVALGIAGFSAFFVINLLRLLHGGTGFPLHLSIEELDVWRPSVAAPVVVFALGSLLTQPLVLLALRPWIVPAMQARADALRLAQAALARGDVDGTMQEAALAAVDGGLVHTGLIGHAHAAWEHALVATVLTMLFATLVSLPAWLRVLVVGPVRAYERERWIDERILVDNAFADAQEIITSWLTPQPRFVGPLPVHYVDPPYNTRALFFGYAPDAARRDAIRFVKPHRSDDVVTEVAPPPPAPAPSPPPAPPAPVTTTAAPAPPPAATTTQGDELQGGWDDASHDDDPTPPALDYFSIGRLRSDRARAHIDVVAPFVSRMTGLSDEQARGMIRNAPDDVRVHQLLGDWKKLRTVLTREAGFALQTGLAPVVAIITKMPVADVERRLRAAPPDKRLTGVFAPELARILLPRKR